ncbi:MAG TPA: hypothetical protein VIL31_05815 [Cyclobacteriaceae bacterium]
MRYAIPFAFAVLLFVAPICAQPQTEIGKGAGEYKELFDALKDLLLKSHFVKKVNLRGKERNQFVPWIRDHVHVMKAMKYFSPEIASFWEAFMESQTDEGLYFDYYYPLNSPIAHRMNLFDKRYWHIYASENIQMHRLPVEADLEYLMVEGAYYIWQATGDNNYVREWLDDLEHGMQYAMSDPLRWSSKHQLVKRGYTLDTWDFMQLPTTREEYTRQGNDVQKGIFDIDENTPMGIMHGDNSGMYAACRQLSEMFASVGDTVKSRVWQLQADLFRTRTNALCWNGKYYAHFVPDDPLPEYLHIDQTNTLSLSNPYDINRGLPTHDMAVSILKTYQELKGKNELNSFAEWFGIYPPVRPHFADYQPGSYMNGGVNTIVGGELAKAALQHGMEEYGVDILNRTLALIRKHKGDLPVAYKPDGTVDEGIPDNWGQAAVMSALIEGLAGVVDKGQLFDAVELSPRWLVAGKNDVEVSVAYGPSKKFVKYHFSHNASRKTIELSVSGDPKRYDVRVLLPAGSSRADITVDGQPAEGSIEQVEESIYVVISNVGAGEHRVRVVYR